MLVEEIDAPLVNTLSDRLADLVRAPSLNHVERGPPVLSLGAGRGTDEQTISQLPLQAILLDVVGQEGGHLSVRFISPRFHERYISFLQKCRGTSCANQQITRIGTDLG